MDDVPSRCERAARQSGVRYAPILAFTDGRVFLRLRFRNLL
jgi:hypothetical protein